MTDISSLFNHHRSIRKFRPDPIDPALVEKVCGDAIAGGSSSGNLNSISIILTRDPERKRRLYELHFEQEMVLEAPLVMTFCADWHRTRQWLRLRGARDNFNNLPLHAFLHDETYHHPTDEEIAAVYREREVRGWERYMSYPELKSMIEARGITSLARFYTSEIKYDPDGFVKDSTRLRALLEAKHFLP